MKVEWTAQDIKAGRIVGKPDRKERWMIGYLGSTSASEHRWCLVSMADGMIGIAQSAKLLADMLTSEGELPAELLPAPRT
jgi:hypothetical protein